MENLKSAIIEEETGTVALFRIYSESMFEICVKPEFHLTPSISAIGESPKIIRRHTFPEPFVQWQQRA